MADAKIIYVYKDWDVPAPEIIGTFELVLSVAPIFGLTKKQANEQLKEIKSVIENNWRALAKKYSLSRGEIEVMAPAFDMEFK